MTRPGSARSAYPFMLAVLGFVVVGLGLIALLYKAHLLPVAGVFAAVVLAAGLAGVRVLVLRRRLVRSVEGLATELRAVMEADEPGRGPVTAGLSTAARSTYDELRNGAYAQAAASSLVIARELGRRPLEGVSEQRLSTAATRLAGIARRLPRTATPG